MGAAALPAGAGQVGGDRLDKSLVGIRGDQPDPRQAAGDEVGEELVPRRPGLGGGDAQAEDLAVPVAVDAGGEQDDGVDDPAAFADLHGERVGGHERERPGRIQRTVPEVLDRRIQVGSHPGDLGLAERVDAQGLDQLVHPPRAHAGEVAVRDDGDQRGLCSFAALEQPHSGK